MVYVRVGGEVVVSGFAFTENPFFFFFGGGAGGGVYKLTRHPYLTFFFVGGGGGGWGLKGGVRVSVHARTNVSNGNATQSSKRTPVQNYFGIHAYM